MSNNNNIYNNGNSNINYTQFNNLNYNHNSNNSFITNSYSNLNTNILSNNFNNYNNNYNNNNTNQRKNSFTSCSCPELVNLHNRNENIDYTQIQKGFKDVENIYRTSCLNNIRDRWKISLQCNYYCNLKPNFFIEESYEEYDRDH